MTLERYLARRAAEPVLQRRPTCDRCLKAEATCYCHMVQPYQAPIRFVILQHPAESRNPIATARMAHLSLTNSELVVGYNFDGMKRVEAMLATPGQRNVLLYPRPDALPLDDVLATSLADAAEPLALWVIDAKWSHVPKMMRGSPLIKGMVATAFVPDAPSRFCVRTQPKPLCLSTVEAIHMVLARRALLAGDGDVRHDAMREVFRYLVRQQLGFCDRDDDTRHSEAKRLRRERRERKERTAG